jgi:hypothetical protein
MGFSGGGSNVLKPHKHSSAVQDGSPLDMNNVTEATLTAGDIVYSDGVALQRLAIGSTADALVVSAGVPTWGAATSNPLIKVSKTFADIAGGSINIYTLPVDAALVNVYTDITSVFNISTGVTIGDAGDDNGFIEAADFTAGTGLTNATRGAYVTTFKTMRSTSGTTAIKAYNFSTSGTTFSQLLTDDNRSLAASSRQELAQQFNAGHILVGENICSASFFIKVDSGTPVGTIRSYIRQSDGTEIQESSTTLDASTVTGSYVEYTFTFPNTTLAATNMITIAATDVTGGFVTCNTQTTEMTNGKLYETNSTGSAYSQLVANEMKMTVDYDCSTDTQGAVDFYLQVVD